VRSVCFTSYRKRSTTAPSSAIRPASK
jgi:hypothetical protein